MRRRRPSWTRQAGRSPRRADAVRPLPAVLPHRGRPSLATSCGAPGAVEAGVNLVDCAEMYPVPQRAETQGRSEAMLGRWLAAAPGRRSRVLIATKAGNGALSAIWPTCARPVRGAGLRVHFPSRWPALAPCPGCVAGRRGWTGSTSERRWKPA